MAAQSSLISASEYLANELSADIRHEFVAGSVYAMAGASRNHGEIIENLSFLLRRELGAGPCRNLGENVKVRVARTNSYYYPDATISCPPRFIDDKNGVIDNPTVLFEILSPGTERVDRGHKFAAYRTLQSLREYVLIESDSVLVEVNTLEDGDWKVRTYRGKESVVSLRSVGVQIALSELYEHTTL